MLGKKEQTIGGFWRRQTKSGEKYLFGKIIIDGKEKILEIWPNLDKIEGVKEHEGKYDVICKALN